MKGMKGYADLADLPEDDRIELMAKKIVEEDLTAGVIVDDDPAKVTRYTNKLEAKGCRVIAFDPGPVPKTVTLTVTRRKDG